MSQIQEQLASALRLETLLEVLVGIVKELTGYHRVMAYQYDQSFNARVVTEVVGTEVTEKLYVGLNFPASDIPRQTGDFYNTSRVCMLYDRDLETVRLLCRNAKDSETLDLTYSHLRAASPIHLKYLSSRGVRSSMSIPIDAFKARWGLVASHSYGSLGMRMSFPIRNMCKLISH
jgi:light-regulated signal transduction histidine kinase (bacteriophytochrome)